MDHNKNSDCFEEHYADPFHRGACEQPTHAAEKVSEQSGCQMRVELQLTENGDFAEAWFDAAGCEVCEALASIYMQFLLEHDDSATAFGSAEKLDEAWLEARLREVAPPAAIGRAKESSCYSLPASTLLAAIRTPLDALDDDLTDGIGFGGPSLREEC